MTVVRVPIRTSEETGSKRIFDALVMPGGKVYLEVKSGSEKKRIALDSALSQVEKASQDAKG